MAASSILQYVTSGAFVLLAVIVSVRWLRHRERSSGTLALAVGLLALVSLIGRINVSTDYRWAGGLAPVSMVAFVGSGYALYVFRAEVLPISRRVLTVVSLIALTVTVAGVGVALPQGPAPRYSPPQFAVVLAVVAVWSFCVGEPAFRFWRAGRGLSSVQRGRLRSLSAGYIGIVAVLFVAVAAGSDQPPVLALIVQLVVLAVVPFLYAAFAPPRWLRRAWRAREEERLQRSVADLMLSDDTAVVADSALRWATALTGAHAGLVRNDAGQTLASRDIRAEVAAAVRQPEATELIRIDGHPAIAVPLRGGVGGLLAVVSGPFTPLIGPEEIAWLERYAITVSTALARCVLVEQLTLSQARLAEAQDIARLGSWHWDVGGDVVTWSDELYRIYGADPATFTATYTTFLQFVHPDDLELVKTEVSRALSLKQPFSYDHRIVRPDGSVRWLHARGHVVEDGTGEVREMRGTALDVTERKEAEAALREADRVKDEFLATVSHELRTPLAMIMGFADVLETRWESLEDERRRDVVRKIDRSGTEMFRLVEQLLDFSRLQAGKVNVEPRRIRLKDAIADLVDRLAQSLEDHVVEIGVSDDVYVSADPHGLDRVLGNLLTNAAKFSPPDARIRIDAEANGELVRVCVRDSGVGIPAADRSRVFDRFYQGRTGLTVKGSGLGLAIARRYVELSGGTIWVEDEEREGSTFAFTLPVG